MSAAPARAATPTLGQRGAGAAPRPPGRRGRDVPRSSTVRCSASCAELPSARWEVGSSGLPARRATADWRRSPRIAHRRDLDPARSVEDEVHRARPAARRAAPPAKAYAAPQRTGSSGAPAALRMVTRMRRPGDGFVGSAIANPPRWSRPRRTPEPGPRRSARRAPPRSSTMAAIARAPGPARSWFRGARSSNVSPSRPDSRRSFPATVIPAESCSATPYRCCRAPSPRRTTLSRTTIRRDSTVWMP